MKQPENIGLALSGGGIRAAIFHLGVLKWLAENGQMSRVNHISTVSGASLCVAMIFARNENRWPDDDTFLHSVLPEIKRTIMENNLQTSAITSLCRSPWNWNRKANLLAKTLEKKWGISGMVKDLPQRPLWSINCTTFETGKDFRINQRDMGDWEFGYATSSSIPVSDAVAASAGFPVLIGAYKLNTSPYRWTKTASREGDGTPCPSEMTILPAFKTLHLWDGGVYDNMGLEALYKISKGGHLTGSLDYLIISNAGSPCKVKQPDPLFTVKNLRRLLDISMDQVTAIRTRDVVDYLMRNDNGYYVRIGSSAERICSVTNTRKSMKQSLKQQCLTEEQASYVRDYPTVLSSPKEEDYDLILRHGYETAMCTALGSRVVG